MPASPHLDRLVDWLLTSGVRIAVVVLVMVVLLVVLRRTADRVERAVRERLGDPARGARARTLSHVVRDASRTVVWVVGGLMVLGEAGLDLGPLLAAAGIGGLAVGLGATSLVRDLISGAFLLFDDRVRVGDVVEVAGVAGAVEEIRLRTLSLRDVAGALHIVPNGRVETVKNMARDYAYAVVDAEVGYGEDTDEVASVLLEVGRSLADDPAFAPRLLAPLEVLGVEALGANGVTVRCRVRTLPEAQWAIGREVRRRVKKAFEARAIEIPFPQRTVWLGRPGDGAALAGASPPAR
jgi:small conductance mechanosensitive channel